VPERKGSPSRLIGLQVRRYLAQELECLPICEAVREAWRVSTACRAFVRDLAATGTLGNKFKHAEFRTRDAHNEATVFVAMLAAECDRSFAIDQSGDIRSIAWVEINHNPVGSHVVQYRKEREKENAARLRERRVMVEAAGQLIHLFRDGPDYAFILRTGCGACYPSILPDES
jgi:hypothetical protein